MKPKYKVGDRVRVKGNMTGKSHHDDKIVKRVTGRVGTIRWITKTNEEYKQHRFEYAVEFYHKAHDLKSPFMSEDTALLIEEDNANLGEYGNPETVEDLPKSTHFLYRERFRKITKPKHGLWLFETCLEPMPKLNLFKLKESYKGELK